MAYQYRGNTETLFDKKGLPTESNCFYSSHSEFSEANVESSTKEFFDQHVACPYNLGGLSDSEYVSFYYDSDKDIISMLDTTDGIVYLFSPNGVSNAE